MESENPIDPIIETEKRKFAFETAIEAVMLAGFQPFESLKKVLAIDSYDTDGKKIAFTLKSEKGEYFHFDCQRDKLHQFLANFPSSKPINNQVNNIEVMSDQTNSPKKENTISDLRETLFATIKKLEQGTMDTDTANTIASISQTILNTAKVEIEYRKFVGGGSVKLLEE